MNSINKDLHILLCLLSCQLFSFLLTINFTLNIQLTTSLFALKIHLINQLSARQFIFFLFCFEQSFSNLYTRFGIREFKTLLNHFTLMLLKDFRDIGFYINGKNFAIFYIHTIFTEESTFMTIAIILILLRRSSSINSYITNNFRIILIEFFNCVFLCFTLNQRTLSIAKILDIIINREPVIHISGIKIHTIRNLNYSLYEILSLNINIIRNLIIFIMEVYGLFKSISCLRLTSAQLKLFKSLIIIKQNSLRTANNLTSTILRYNINCITSPNIQTDNTIILIINSNSTRLSVRSTTRNTSISLKISKSLELTVNIIYAIGNTISSCTIKIRSSSLYTLSNSFFQSLLSKTSIIFKSLLITGEPQFTLMRAQLTLNNDFSTRIRQIHCRTFNSFNLTIKTIHHIDAFAFWNSNSMMKNLLIIINDSMLRTRIINHLFLTSDKKLFANRMNSTIIIRIFSNNLYINTRNRRKFNCTENITTFRRSYKIFSRLREHNFRTMNITLITIFILQNTIFKTFKSNSVTNITILILILERNYFNTSRRNIERNISTLNNKNLTIYIIAVFRDNFITLSIKNLATFRNRGLSIIYTSQQILVSAERMTLYSLSHLTRIKCEGDRAGNINLTTNLNIFWKIIRGSSGWTTAIRSRIFQNQIPILRRRSKQRNSIRIRTRNKSLALRIKANKFIRLRQRSLSRTNMTKNIAFGSVKNISILINRKNQIFLHHTFTHKYLIPHILSKSIYSILSVFFSSG